MSADREMDHLEMMSGMIDRHHNQPYCYADVEPEEPTDELDRALHLAYEAYMRGLYRESVRKNNELLWKAIGRL